jgi:hypothetical protein
MILSDATRDSLQKLFAGIWDFRTPLPKTQGERDRAGREQARLAAEAHDQHRPMMIPLGGGSVPFHLFSRGPSPEQRKRDSIIDADNLARLARLAERARLKRDSMLAANRLARSDSNRARRAEP